MRLLQDGVVAALAAIGLTTLIFLFLSALVHPRRRGALPATAVIVDGGLSEEARSAAALLCRSEYEVYLCKKEELTDFFT